jgi:hypothetical protein
MYNHSLQRLAVPLDWLLHSRAASESSQWYYIFVNTLAAGVTLINTKKTTHLCDLVFLLLPRGSLFGVTEVYNKGIPRHGGTKVGKPHVTMNDTSLVNCLQGIKQMEPGEKKV